MPNIGVTLAASFNSAFYAVVNFIPKFLAGAIILLVGIIIASILRQLIVTLFKVLKVEKYLKKYGVPEAKDAFNWTNILAELVRWFVIILFLIPTAEVWGLPQIIAILNEFLTYLPNVFVAAVIAMVGFAFARLAMTSFWPRQKALTVKHQEQSQVLPVGQSAFLLCWQS